MGNPAEARPLLPGAEAQASYWKQVGSIWLCQILMKEEIMALEGQMRGRRGPRMVEIGIDSCAGVSVWPSSWDTDYPLEETEESRSGTEYYPAGSGTTIRDLGRRVLCCKVNGNMMKIQARVCDVRKPLVSVGDAVDAGHVVVFGKYESYMLHEETGVRNQTWRKNGVYELTAEMIPYARSGSN